MANQLKTSIVRIRTADGLVVGAGFLVADRHILTCAHVVSRSLGLFDTPADAPLAKVLLDFPLLAPRRMQTARVVYWQPPQADNRGDIAGLELDGEPPINATPMRLVIADEIQLHPFNILGPPHVTADYASYESGLTQLQARIATSSADYEDFLLYQQRLTENIDKARNHGDTETRRAERSEIIASLNDLARAALGFSFNELCEVIDQTTSGAPVWDERLSGVVGMAASIELASGPKVPPVIPAEVLYIARLVIEQERKKGILAYVELSAQADATEQATPAAPDPTRKSAIVDDWGLDSEFSLLEGTTPSNVRSVTPDSQERKKRRFENILEAVNTHDRFVLIGEPGAGKSTTIRRLARDAARARLDDPQAPLPVLLDLPRWGDGATPAEFVLASSPFGDDPTNQLAAGDVLLFLDGLNEMGKEGPRKAGLLREWLRAADGPKRVIVTCRAAEYVGDLDLGLPTVLAEELDEPRIRRFVERYLEASAAPFLEKLLPQQQREREDARHLFRLARNPYLLTALILVYRGSHGGELPRNTGALFKALVRTLWKREEQKQTSGWMALDQMEAAFASLAFAMIDQGQPIDVPYDWAVRKLLRRRWWQRTGDSKQITALMEAGSGANLLEIHGNNVRFYHQLIQEYFAAVALNGLNLRDRLACPWLTDRERRAEKWDQVIVALCGIAPHKADAVVAEVLTKDPYIAAMCIASSSNVSEVTQQSVIASLITDLGVQDRSVRTATSKALRQIGAAAVPGLLGALRDQAPLVREEAAYALGLIRDTAAVPDLREALCDPEGFVRTAAAEALGWIGDSAAVPSLLAALRDPRGYGRIAAAKALGRIGDSAAVPSLLEALHDPEVFVRPAAAKALGWIGDAAVPGLLEALHDPDQSMRAEAAEALGQIRNAAAVPDLLAALRDLSDVRDAAAKALGSMRTAAVPGLLEALHDSDEYVRMEAAVILGKIKDSHAVPGLIARLSDPTKVHGYGETRVCDFAAAALERIATPEARAAVAEWRRVTGNDQRHI